MGQQARKLTATLQSNVAPAVKHAAVEQYLCAKVKPQYSTSDNRLHVWGKTDALERAVGEDARAIVRYEWYRLDQNLGYVCGRKALGAMGLSVVDRINKAVYSSKVRSLARDYLVSKITSKTSEADNLALLERKRDALLTQVASSCVPLVREEAALCIAQMYMYRLRHAERARRTHSGPSTSYSSSAGTSGL